MSRPLPELSVVVPTRDRPASLVRCLAALGRLQDLGPYEVVVVDDGSRDLEAVRRAVSAHPFAHVVEGDGRGPAAARNRGAEAALAPLLLFTDDDCRPDPAWAARLRDAVAHVDGPVAGRVVNARTEDPFAAASQSLTNFLAERGAVTFAPSNNLACPARVMRELPWEEGYPDAAGEDREWCARLVAAGDRLGREPRAVVHHEQELGWRGFIRQQLRYGRGAHVFRSAAPGVRSEPPSFYVALLAHGFRHGVRVGVLVLVAQLAVAAGYAQGIRAHARNVPGRVRAAGAHHPVRRRSHGNRFYWRWMRRMRGRR